MPKSGLEALAVVEQWTADAQHSSSAYTEHFRPFAAAIPVKDRQKEPKKWQTVLLAEFKRQTLQHRENN